MRTGNLGSVIVIVVTSCGGGRDGLRQPGGRAAGLSVSVSFRVRAGRRT